ncbi:MAG TPA: hypothetical protein VMB52_04295 [Verrucomicrobiae bacterium]|nr:hypothetical protein [Verrucomicrobiae bacterium]
MAQNYSPSIPQFSPPATEQTSRSMTAEESRQELRQAIYGSNQVLASAHTLLTFSQTQ